MSFRYSSVFSLIGVWFFGLISIPAKAILFAAEIEQSQWYLSASIFECSLTHNIPEYGKGVFYHEAGEDLTFYVDAFDSPMAPGKAALVIEAPAWQPGVTVGDLGFVPVNRSPRPILVPNKSAAKMLYGLMQGMNPTFTRKAWYGDETVKVKLNSINFRGLYSDYQACVATLLPVNFRQVERTKVHFESDKAKLTRTDRKVLDRLILYVKADSSVSAIYVDGHTDSSGRRIYNRRLSKERAEAVTQYLIDKGLSADMITTRYHGERYPVVKNNTRTNKAKNRRTTVRLVRANSDSSDDEFDQDTGADTSS